MSVCCKPLRVEHWEKVRTIFAEGIASGQATFETEAPEWAVWDRGHLLDPRLVAVEADKIVGWAAVSPVSGRCVYGGVAEVSVYVAAAARGRGVGRLARLAQHCFDRIGGRVAGSHAGPARRGRPDGPN